MERRQVRSYTSSDLKLVRGKDPEYGPDFKVKLGVASERAIGLAKAEGRTLVDGKLAGISRISEKDSIAELGLMQMGYVDFEAMNLMVREGEQVPNEYRENIGVMSTIATADGKSLHAKRASTTATWGGYDSLFGRGLTGNDGNVDWLVERGTGYLFDVISKQLCAELGIEESEIDSLELKGVAEGRTYRDHTIAFNAGLKSESGRLVADGISKKPKTPKYDKIFAIDVTPECVGDYLVRNNCRIVDVALAQIVLTGSSLFGESWIDDLRKKGVVD